MKTAILLGLFAFAASAADQKPMTLKAILLEQLMTTHDVKDWFVPVKVALDGVTAEQATWKDNKGNHSIGQLAYHLLYWNRQQLSVLRGEKPQQPGSNEETFNSFDASSWNKTMQELEQVLTHLEKFVEQADEQKLAPVASNLAHIGTHNAYHTGQIIYIRRLQGSWDPEKGVK